MLIMNKIRLTARAFYTTLQKRQAGYGELLACLAICARASRCRNRREGRMLERVVHAYGV